MHARLDEPALGVGELRLAALDAGDERVQPLLGVGQPGARGGDALLLGLHGGAQAGCARAFGCEALRVRGGLRAARQHGGGEHRQERESEEASEADGHGRWGPRDRPAPRTGCDPSTSGRDPASRGPIPASCKRSCTLRGSAATLARVGRPFPLLAALPPSLRGVVLDFEWSHEALWALDLPAVPVDGVHRLLRAEHLAAITG